ncbi:phosphotransferase [Novosphingobium sp. SL115]|uniref:phosphotransferase family protein n=1 Tax=Novosphingobium sp. SL115 TaxID=2995150 RepID=UPI0022761DA7|nr:phosphotransferase [Novosphingobium sp. SL115]MCY1671547.1 phosphotransferase [Novosphingobium sp. SL115]
MADFPTQPGDVEMAWLEQQLAQAGVLGDARVVDMAWQSIGTGQVGDTARFTLTYDGPAPGAPVSVAAKFPSHDATSRQTAASFSLYKREVWFYREVAGLIDMRVPRTYAALLDDNGCDFVLLFEDLGPCQAGNQLAGCTLAEAEQAMRQAAALHAPTMNHPVLDADWLKIDPQAHAMLRSLYPQAQKIFRERYASDLAPELMAICDELDACADLWFERQHRSRSFLHGDFRLDNMLFGIRGGAEPIALVDWQTAATGCGLTDIGYFLGCGIGSALRRPNEAALLDLYCAEMTRRGVSMARDDIMDDYRIGTLHGVSTAVFSSAFVVRTDRGDANFLSMARGACELALDHDSLGALKRRMEHV